MSISNGITFFGTGDFIGQNLNLKYQRVLYKHISLFSRVGISSGNKQFPGTTLGNPYLITFWANNSRKIDIGPSFKINKSKKHMFSISPALSYLRTTKFSTGGYYLNESLIDPPLEFQYFSVPPRYSKIFSIGYAIGVDYKLQLKNGVFLGLDSLYQRYQNFDVESSLSLSTGYVF